MGFLAKLLSCSFLMDQPGVTRPVLASALALQMLSEPVEGFPPGGSARPCPVGGYGVWGAHRCESVKKG